MKYEPSVCIVTAVYNRWHETKQCLEACSRLNYNNWHVIVVDSGSTDGTPQEIEKYNRVEYIRLSNEYWWPAAINVAIRTALNKSFDYVMLLDSDCMLPADALEKLIQITLDIPNCIVHPLVANAQTDEIQYAGKFINWAFPIWRRPHSKYYDEMTRHINDHRVIQTDVVYSKGLLVKSDYFMKVGLLREDMHYHADEGWSLHAKSLGYALYMSRDVIVSNIQEPRISKSAFHLSTYFDKRSDINFRDTWAFFYYYCPYSLIVKLLLFFSYYVEYFYVRFLHQIIKRLSRYPLFAQLRRLEKKRAFGSITKEMENDSARIPK